MDQNKKKLKFTNHDFSKVNNLLGMFTVPYLGVYGQDYTFFTPIKIFQEENPSSNLINSFPDTLKKNITQFRKNYNVETDYFDITIDGSFILNKFYKTNISHFLRVNTVLHPYIFYNIENVTNREHKTLCFCALFRDGSFVERNSNYISDTGENDCLRIDPNVIISESNKKEVILHDSGEGIPAISPNNMAFLMDLKNNFFSFYIMNVCTYGNQVTKLLISRIVVIMNTEIPIFKILNRAFIGMQKNENFYEKNIKHDNSELNSNINNIEINNNKNYKNIGETNFEFENNFNQNTNLISKVEEKMKFFINQNLVENNLVKIHLDNFLTELSYFENLVKIVFNYIKGFIFAKIIKFFNENKNFITNLKNLQYLKEFTLNLIKTCYENIFFDENFAILNKNSQINFYDILEGENLNHEIDINLFEDIPINKNDNDFGKGFVYENKINDYYPNKSFDIKKNIPNKKQGSDHKIIGEYGFFKFMNFIKMIFKNPDIDNFGLKIFEDYLKYTCDEENYFFLKLIDTYFLFELEKYINICNCYRIYFNEYEIEIPLSDALNKSSINSISREKYSITNRECNK